MTFILISAMNIVLLTTDNPQNIAAWSGTWYHILGTLEQEHNVYVVGTGLLQQCVNFTINNFIHPKQVYQYATFLAKICSERIRSIPDVDIVLGGDITIDAFLDLDAPFIGLSDATFAQMYHFRGEEHRPYTPAMLELERLALTQSYDAMVYPSTWPLQYAQEYLASSNTPVHIIEFGANIPYAKPWKQEIDRQRCHLLFIGRDWKAKGGDIAWQTLNELKHRGLSCHLTIIGCLPPQEVQKHDDVEVIPYLDKSKKEDLERYCNILSTAHFLLHPTRFEAFGIVLAEASAYGIPALVAEVGGTSQVIINGRNGYVLPYTAKAVDYANKIMESLSDEADYKRLRKTSREEYKSRLNWGVWLQRMNQVFAQVTLHAHNNKTICT